MALRCFYINYIPCCVEILSELTGDISHMEYPDFRRFSKSPLPGSVLRGGRIDHRHTRVRPDKRDGLLHADVIADALFKLRVDVRPQLLHRHAVLAADGSKLVCIVFIRRGDTLEQGDAVGRLLDSEAVDCFRLCVLAELLLGLAGKLQIARFRPKFSPSPIFRSRSKAAERIRRIASLFRLGQEKSCPETSAERESTSTREAPGNDLRFRELLSCTACGRSLRVPFTALKASGGNPRRNRGSWCGI